MNLARKCRPESFANVRLATTVLLFAAALLMPVSASAEDDAKQILKKMSDYLAAETSFSATFDSDIEVITTELEKIQFTSSGSMQVSRPGKIHARRTGGYNDVELFLDGKTLTVVNKDQNAYAQASAPDSIDKTVDLLRNDFSAEVPGADLILSNVYDALSEDVLEAKHVGDGVINGVECDHLAFRNEDTDWQLWVQKGDKPIPRKYVITSKAVAGAPEYTLIIKDWNEGGVPGDAFAFSPPADAKKVDFKELKEMDEVPAGTVIGGSQ